MIRAVLMDIDDTLLSFSGYVRQTMREGFREFGLAEYDEAMYQVFKRINTMLWKRIEQGTLTFAELLEIRWNTIFSELKIDFDGRVFEKYFRGKLFDSAVLEPGARELLEYLRGKYTLCAASNGPFEQQLNRLRTGGLYEYFDHFFISEKIGAQKPGREFFDHCLRELRKAGEESLAPEDVMIVGDSVSADISGGKLYGLKTCLYIGDNPLPEGASEADHIVRKLSEITKIL